MMRTSTRFLPGSPFMRWASTIAVAAPPTLFAVSAICRRSGNEIGALISDLGIFPCVMFIGLCFFIQPRPIQGEPDRPLDERETILRDKATRFGYSLPAGAGILICWYMYSASGKGWWTPHRDDWLSLEFVLLAWILGMPMSFANWLVPRPVAVEDGEQ